MKKTAVDWLIKEVELISNSKEILRDKIIELYNNAIQQAKQMEKEQIKEAHLNGQSEWDIKALEDINKKLAEEYYKEAYE